MMIRVVVGVCVLLFAHSLYAAETQDSVVTQSITSTDVSPPSVPTNVQATPLSVSSIQLNYSPSTDNVAVTGYRIYRDGVVLATTTLTSYLDTALATSTAYSYYVTAFDAADNTSASSTVVSATTLSPVVPTESADSNAGRQFSIGTDIKNVHVTAGETEVTVRFTTDRFVRSRATLGTDIETVSVQLSDRLQREHAVTFTNLAPGTAYRVDLEIFIDERFVVDSRQLHFQTSAVADTEAPANVRSLHAQDNTHNIVLTWQNPLDADFDRVRVVRSTRWFPADLVDGWVVYEGSGTTFSDTVSERPVYYTVFSLDANDNRSSGAITYVPLPSEDSGNESDWPGSVVDFPVPPDFSDDTTQSVPVYIVQANQVYELDSTQQITLTTATPFTVRVPAEMFAERLHTVVGSVAHPDAAAGTFHFLLKRSPDGAYYEATIGALPVRGQYQVAVRWLDFATRSTGVTNGMVRVVSVVSDSPPAERRWWLVALFGLLLLVGLRILWAWRRGSAV